MAPIIVILCDPFFQPLTQFSWALRSRIFCQPAKIAFSNRLPRRGNGRAGGRLADVDSITTADPEPIRHPFQVFIFSGALLAVAIPQVRAAAPDSRDSAQLSHWSFSSPQRPVLAEVNDVMWPSHSMGHFLLARLEAADRSPAPRAEKTRLICRATLDLTGLPPTLVEVDAFLSDDSPNAYEKVIDRLLASPRYGERMAVVWLDLARYADTDGYQDDEPRTMWRWREWLIDTLNENLAFDQFTLQVLAGDLFPDRQPQQHLATGFLRNNRANGEGGSIAEEFRVEYVVDRLETVGATWLGLTIGCARCHDHKYDPLTQKEFFELFAFFNQIPEPGRYRRSAPPTIKVPGRTVQHRLDVIDRQLAIANDNPTRHEELNKEKEKLLAEVPETMVMEDGDFRKTFLLIRGQYDQPGIQVESGVPASLPPLPNDGPRNRLGLARWLVDPAHPLTARVTVNRLWQIHFGSALVKTTSDFGIQGDRPTYPALLDWLATELIRLQWNVKALQRMLMTSATYGQSSRREPAHKNTSWASKSSAPATHTNPFTPFARVRLSAEMIRDQALAVSGLLADPLGGPSVKPYQPEGLWDEIAGVTTSIYKDGYQTASGEDLYRRSLYTFWRRTIHPPGMAVFDAPSREMCAPRRQLTNTPLQALALMNDVIYVEASRGLAGRMLREGGDTPGQRASFGFRLVTSRHPNAAELDVLLTGLRNHLATYQDNQEAASQLIHVGESAPDPNLAVTELAAYTAFANTLLNLDEVINRE